LKKHQTLRKSITSNSAYWNILAQDGLFMSMGLTS